MNQQQRAQYDRFPSNLTRTALRTHNSTAGYLSTGASFREGNLDPRDRELVIVRVAALSGSAYERMQHLPVARSVGWTDMDILAIEAGDQLALGARAAALLRFVDECVYRVKVSAAAFACVKAFHTDGEIVELTLLIGHYMMTARFLETLEVDIDDQPTPWSGLSAT
jgi:alkylhydroperoxidase family enzyme